MAADLAMKNTAARYGFVTKVLRWAVFLLILNPFVVAAAMPDTPQGETTAGFTQGTLYNGHESIGRIARAGGAGALRLAEGGPAARLGAQPERG